jgi:sensor c-di-GMP phosphodiesterase-like protein
VPLNDQIGLGVLDTQNVRVIAELEHTDRTLLTTAAVTASGRDSFREKDNYFVIRRSNVLPVMVVAYTPLTGFFQDFVAQLELWLPLGFLVGSLVAWLLLKLLRQRLSTRNQLLEALQLQQFQVHYQPIIELASGRCVGAEALLRWRLPNGSYVSPDIFIPQAQIDGLIEPITDCLISLVFTDMGGFLASRPDLRVSINLAPEDLQTRRVLDTLPALLKEHRVAASQLCIEATERGFIDAERARLVIDAFREAGHPVYIDDFGTGYSSLSYLQELNVDVLKIDKSFVDTLATDGVTNKVALHIIEMAHALNLIMIAEGIEDLAQVEYLRENGVQYGQGWLFAKAMPIKRFIEFCTERRAID